MNKRKIIIKMRRTTIFFFSLLFLLSGCSSSDYGVLLNKSHKAALSENHKKENDISQALNLSRTSLAVSRLMDSVITLINQKERCDTIFIVDECNPPLFEYHAYIWGRTTVYLLKDGYPTTNICVDNSFDKRFKSLIEEWNQQSILIYSNSKPFTHYHPWTKYVVASRIILAKGVPTDISSVVFKSIDFDYRGTPSFIN